MSAPNLTYGIETSWKAINWVLFPSSAQKSLYTAENEGFRRRIGTENALRGGWMRLPARGSQPSFKKCQITLLPLQAGDDQMN